VKDEHDQKPFSLENVADMAARNSPIRDRDPGDEDFAVRCF
jgi:hypothetical protein